jgi:hypothetical protein
MHGVPVYFQIRPESWATMHLTNSETRPHSCAVASDFPGAAGAPGDIEITREMVLAGKEEMSCRWTEFVHGPGSIELWDEVLSKVFLAMLEARPR